MNVEKINKKIEYKGLKQGYYCVFDSLISSVETSRLNYILTRTPFIATISLKRSFAKFHDHIGDEETRNEIEESKEENNELYDKIRILEEKLRVSEDNKDNLEKVYNFEKEKVKATKDLEGEFRVELLKLKSEKHSLISNNKSLQVRVDELEKECDTMQKENKDLETKLKWLNV
jgi:chromosome segregation ATPase